MSDDLFKEVELKTPQNTDTSVKNVVTTPGPKVTDLGWNDYVLSLFHESELYEGRPLCAGLRRVAELVLGTIVSSRPLQVWAPTESNSIGRSTVIWEVIFSDGSLFSDVADAWEGNTDDAFCVFSTATAATRAEGRALRKALRLKTVAAEEMTKKNTVSIVKAMSKPVASTEGEYDDSQRMTDAQANFIDVKCHQLDIDVKKFFKEVLNSNLSKKVSKAQASVAIQKLNDYQQDKTKIPSSITGYLNDWRN